tara:strand:+ start:1265 stop:1840 length:576 start_codon:yes stop_codon:yes gene_type:complete
MKDINSKYHSSDKLTKKNIIYKRSISQQNITGIKRKRKRKSNIIFTIDNFSIKRNKLYDSIMKIQYNNIYKHLIFANRTFCFISKKSLSDYFDLKSEIKYFLKYIGNFGYNYYSENKVNYIFRIIKKMYIFKKVFENSVKTKNNNCIIDLNKVEKIIFKNDLIQIIKRLGYKILKHDYDLNILILKNKENN